MSTGENLKLAASVWHALASGDWSAIEAAYEADVAYHGSIEFSCRDDVLSLVKSYKQAFPDLTVRLQMQVEDGDLVATRVLAKGTNTGPLLGLPPTGQSLEIALMNTVRVANGRVVEEWESFDSPSLLQHLGVIPS